MDQIYAELSATAIFILRLDTLATVFVPQDFSIPLFSYHVTPTTIVGSSCIFNSCLVSYAFERIGKSSFRESSLIKPIFGAAGRMGKVATEAPALAANPTLKGTFKADLNAMNSWGPQNLGKPNKILKGFGGYGGP